MRLAGAGLVQSCHYKQKIHSHKALQRKYTDLFAEFLLYPIYKMNNQSLQVFAKFG